MRGEAIVRVSGGFYIDGMLEVWLNSLPQYANRLRYTSVVAALHSPDLCTYLFCGQDSLGIAHEVKQETRAICEKVFVHKEDIKEG